MDKVQIVVDPGSTHMGKLDYAIELVEMAIYSGADYIKFQMGVTKPNIDLPKEWWPILREKAGNRIGLTASTFDKESYKFILSQNPPFMKFAYSQKDRTDDIEYCIRNGILTVVSCDKMSINDINPHCIRLYCVPEYPVKYLIDFFELFPPFDGFSDHTLGYLQTVEAIDEGAEWIEKHIKLDYEDVKCPDANFAIDGRQLRTLITCARSLQNE